MGRPAGRDYPVIKQVRLGTQDAEELARLAGEWRCSESAAIRRAIHEKAQESGAARSRTPLVRRKASKEQLRQAAEAARHYYATDPDARAWTEFMGDEPGYDQG